MFQRDTKKISKKIFSLCSFSIILLTFIAKYFRQKPSSNLTLSSDQTTSSYPGKSLDRQQIVEKTAEKRSRGNEDRRVDEKVIGRVRVFSKRSVCRGRENTNVDNPSPSEILQPAKLFYTWRGRKLSKAPWLSRPGTTLAHFVNLVRGRYTRPGTIR